MKTPIEYLDYWLSFHHREYTSKDLFMSSTPGYLKSRKPCNCTYPPYDGYTNFIPAGKTHYHTIYVGGIKGFGRGAYAFWRKLKSYLPTQ